MKGLETKTPIPANVASLSVVCGAILVLGTLFLTVWIGSPKAARTVTNRPLVERDSAATVRAESGTIPGAAVIRIADKGHKGVIRADLEPDYANFADRQYDTILFDVGSPDRQRLIALAAEELAASRQVVLDSDGSDTQMDAVADIAIELAGAGQKAEGLVIFKSDDGGMNLTPIETEASHENRESIVASPLPRGNTARHVLGKRRPFDR